MSEGFVLETAKKRSKAMVDGDFILLDALIDENFTYTNSMGKTYNKSKYIQMIAMQEEMVWKSQAYEETMVQIVDNIAILNAVLHDAFLYKNEAYDARFKTLHVYIKKNNQWIWLAGQTTEIV